MMTSTIVDSVVLIDVFLNDKQWADWSKDAILKSAHDGPLIINPIIYAEVAPSFEREEDLEAALPKSKFNREDLPYKAGFLAGLAHYKYRRSGGTRERTLPDFFVGAHAQVRNHRILTRDGRRYRMHFPSVEIIAPDTHP
jgi:predicted nucleic acid-binding protein